METKTEKKPLDEKKKKILMAVGTLAAILFIYFLFEAVMYVSTDNAQIEGHAVMLAPKVSGFVIHASFEEGQKVKKGDVLIELDDRDYQNALNQVQAELSSIEARKKDAEKNYKRISELFAKEAVSRQQYDSSTASYSEIKAKYDSLSAQVAQAQLNFDNAKIRAPSNGFIAKKSVEIGQYASPGVPLIGFVDSEERWVTANFKETELEGIKVGNKVNISVDALPSRSFTGKVSHVTAATGATFTLLPPDNSTGNFTKVVQRVPVRIQLENLTEEDIEHLRAGLSAVVKVHKY